jgi:hypothetical protein
MGWNDPTFGLGSVAKKLRGSFQPIAEKVDRVLPALNLGAADFAWSLY